jgi:hypothetical protein
VPEGIAQVEKAVPHGHIPALLERALPVCGTVKAAGGKLYAFAAVQGALLIKGHILKQFHGVSSFAGFCKQNTPFPLYHQMPVFYAFLYQK